MKKNLSKCLLVTALSLILSASAILAQTSSSEIEQSILNELNEARANPQTYITYLEEHKKKFKGSRADYPDFVMETFEGTAAVDEAIKFLKKQSKLAPLTFSEALSKPAKLQLNDLIENPTLGHKGKDGSNLPKRLSKFGIKPTSHYAENIMQDANLPRQIVLWLIIDDGVKDRGHRKNIFDKAFKQVGISYGLAKNGRGVSVMVFAGTFIETAK